MDLLVLRLKVWLDWRIIIGLLWWDVLGLGACYFIEN